jgi:hypothetical protein
MQRLLGFAFDNGVPDNIALTAVRDAWIEPASRRKRLWNWMFRSNRGKKSIRGSRQAHARIISVNWKVLIMTTTKTKTTKSYPPQSNPKPTPKPKIDSEDPQDSDGIVDAEVLDDDVPSGAELIGRIAGPAQHVDAQREDEPAYDHTNPLVLGPQNPPQRPALVSAESAVAAAGEATIRPARRQ